MAQRPEGWRAPGSRVGFPHGKDKHRERSKRERDKLESANRAQVAAKKGRA